MSGVFVCVSLQGFGGLWDSVLLLQHLHWPSCPSCVCPNIPRKVPCLHDLLHVHHVLFTVGLISRPHAQCLPVVVPSRAFLDVGVSAYCVCVCVCVCV